MLCIRGICYGPVSVCLSVSVFVSVTSRSSTKTDKRQIRPGSPPAGAPNVGEVGQNRRLSTNNRLYLENGTRYTHSFY